jgi:flagellar hook-associated protein FlgK
MVNNIDSSASTSVASLVDVGLSNVLSVSGTAANGVGGVHTISVTGSQALQSTFTSAGVAGGLSANGTLASYGVTVFNDFTLSVDGGIADAVSGLSGTSTVSDLLSAINQIEGVSAALVDTGGGVLQVEITRSKAGDPVDYSFESSDSVANNIVDQIFGVAVGVGNTFVSAGGAATTFVATDSFQPNRGSGPAAGPAISTLGLIIDNNSGLVTGLSDIGGSGIQILTATGGLATTIDGVGTDYPLLINTADTMHTSSIGVYDSQGGKHILSIQFFRSIVDNRWEWEASTLGDETITSGSTGYVSFNQDGSLNTFDYTGGATRVTIDPQNGAGNMEITFDAGTVGGYSGLTGFASGSHTATLNSQNGYGMGILEKISIDKAGYISGIFSNGITRVLAQIMLADFANQGGLRKTGKSLYQPTGNSGLAQVGVAGETIGGELLSGALESSAVDIAAEFTSMITAQRGFQANARIISTSDSMLDELVNIKR